MYYILCKVFCSHILVYPSFVFRNKRHNEKTRWETIFPELLIKTAWHPGLHRLITKGWNLFFSIWKKHCLHNTGRFTTPCAGLQHTAIRQNIDGQPEPWNSGRDGYSIFKEEPEGPRFQIKILDFDTLFKGQTLVMLTQRGGKKRNLRYI